MFSNGKKKIYSLHDAEQVMHDIFGLTLPTTEVKLKSAFRATAKKTHSDLNRTSSDEEFIKVKNAYDALLECSEFMIEIFGHDRETTEVISLHGLKTNDGTYLVDLGLGLGPTTNARPCESCESKGYGVHYHHDSVSCSDCAGTGRQIQISKCLNCDGTGKFKQRRSGRIVDCLSCKGSGQFKRSAGYSFCKSCGGLGVAMGRGKKYRSFEKCYTCKGAGEVALFNPVFSKGRLA